jgi:hypothetical protein
MAAVPTSTSTDPATCTRRRVRLLGLWRDSLRRLAELAGITGFQLHATPIIDGHPRIIASLTLATDDALDPAHRE